MERLRANPVIRGRGEGRALVSAEALSFWGDVDPATGRVTNARHPLHGERLGGRVLVYPFGRGSCTTSNILLELIRTGQAPAAIVTRSVEPVLAVGPLVGEALYGRTIPMVTVEAEEFARIRAGDWLVVDASAGEIQRDDVSAASAPGLEGQPSAADPQVGGSRGGVVGTPPLTT